MSDALTIVLCGSPTASDAARALEQQLADALARMPNTALIVVPHLYDLAPAGAAMQHLKAVSGDLLVLGWLPSRATHWILRAHGIEGQSGPGPGARAMECIDLRGRDVASVLAEVRRIVAGGAGRQSAEDGSAAFQPGEANPASQPAAPLRIAETTSPRWYPVIDSDRCVNCLECLNFCLFGAYGLDDEGKLFVEQPEACRDGCPACARICPVGAILFPAYHDPAIAGDDAAAPTGSAPPQTASTPANIQELAQAERQRAMSAQGSEAGPSAEGDLDRLVHELGDADL
jgi:NAD-dependent dihydropyrimidine dehydrogenase PreA subunit